MDRSLASEENIEAAAKRLVSDYGFFYAYRTARRLERTGTRHHDRDVQQMGKLWQAIAQAIRRQYRASIGGPAH